MVEAAQARQRSHGSVWGRPWFDRPLVWGVLIQGIVNPVLMVIAHIFAQEPEEMAFVQRDHVVQDLSAAASDPAFRGSIGQGRQLHRMVTLLIPTSR